MHIKRMIFLSEYHIMHKSWARRGHPKVCRPIWIYELTNKNPLWIIQLSGYGGLNTIGMLIVVDDNAILTVQARFVNRKMQPCWVYSFTICVIHMIYNLWFQCHGNRKQDKNKLNRGPVIEIKQLKGPMCNKKFNLSFCHIKSNPPRAPDRMYIVIKTKSIRTHQHVL